MVKRKNMFGRLFRQRKTTLCKYVFAVLVTGILPYSGVLSQVHQPLQKLPEDAFPAAVQFSPVPSPKGWTGEHPLTLKLQKETVDNMIAHGFSVLSIGNWTVDDQTEQNKSLLEYAQSRGMKINYITGGLEIFKRDSPPLISVYSPLYRPEVKRRVDSALAATRDIQRIYTVFPFQDEPFHAGPQSFDYSIYAKNEFQKRYGYPMPDSLGQVRNDPKKWLDLLNFQSVTFRDGWRQEYKIIKDFNPHLKVVLTHDSHSAFGGGVHSDSKVAMDDVFHWGGDFADMFIYDIYPYTMFDYRFGEPGKVPKPRISQMHYTISQLRNVTTTYGKDLAFWVGTYNAAWFRRFMGPERKAEYWAEHELAFTAIAQGANFLITGIKIPSDSLHWADFGKAMNIIQNAGPGLMKAPKVKAKACFLFPRTQYLQLQQEYFNEGLTFELFLRAFGELDIIHEDQITSDRLNGYKVLVLADVKLLPEDVALHIAEFVRKGGIVIADCVPQMGAFKQPMDVMRKLFGVDHSSTDRIVRRGQWVPFTTLPPKMAFAPADEVKDPKPAEDEVSGSAFGQKFSFPVVSPRPASVSNAKTLLRMKSSEPALMYRQEGKGKVYLFGFCIQDTYFATWKNKNAAERTQLRNLVSDVFNDANIRSHVYSSNPDIEASIRASANQGFLFIINHEATDSVTTVRLADLQFPVQSIVDIRTGKRVPFTHKNGTVDFTINAPIGTTRLLKIR
jgi:hypothetical protein